jgi:hypothetical protein
MDKELSERLHNGCCAQNDNDGDIRRRPAGQALKGRSF